MSSRSSTLRPDSPDPRMLCICKCAEHTSAWHLHRSLSSVNLHDACLSGAVSMVCVLTPARSTIPVKGFLEDNLKVLCASALRKPSVTHRNLVRMTYEAAELGKVGAHMQKQTKQKKLSVKVIVMSWSLSILYYAVACMSWVQSSHGFIRREVRC